VKHTQIKKRKHIKHIKPEHDRIQKTLKDCTIKDNKTEDRKHMKIILDKNPKLIGTE